MYGQEGYESDEPEEITPTQLCRYVSAIKKQLIKEQLDTEGDRGLAEYKETGFLDRKYSGCSPMWKCGRGSCGEYWR